MVSGSRLYSTLVGRRTGRGIEKTRAVEPSGYHHHHLHIMADSKEPKKSRKSVSFLIASNDSNDDVNQVETANVPAVPVPVALIPLHLPLVLFFLFKMGLTDKPFRGMVECALLLLIGQMIYGYVLVSVALRQEGSSRGSPSVGSRSKNGGGDKWFIVFSATFVSVLLANCVFFLLILFGAPVLSHVKESYVLSFHLALIGLQPLFILFRLDYDLLAALLRDRHLASLVMSNPILCGTVSTFLGTWLGVIPIPLDWDRPWQQFPLTLLSGAYIGGFVGVLLSVIFSPRSSITKKKQA